MLESVETEHYSLSLQITSDIVSSFVGQNEVSAEELPGLIVSVYNTVAKIANTTNGNSLNFKPAVAVENSIHDEYLICLEDGKQFKSLKRHLMTHYGLSPDAYRKKWGLPSDYPMVAPSYAKARSRLAKQMGLGQKR